MISLPKSFLQIPIAHRGLHDLRQGRPENSLGAVTAAVAAGYGVEIDLQPASDGTPMVFHDATLDRMTQTSGAIRVHSAEALSRETLAETGETIPTLATVLACVNGAVPLLIEVKAQADGYGEFAPAIASVIGGYIGPLALMSFDPEAVAALQTAAPKIARGLTTEISKDETLAPEQRDRLTEIRDFERVGACFISHDRASLDHPRVRALKADGVPILTWTIRSVAEETKARTIADNITFEDYAAHLPTG